MAGTPPLVGPQTTGAAVEPGLATRSSSLDSPAEYAETRSVTLEWRITGLKAMFESTKGDAKSKCIKSALFDSQRWQIFFYPNAGSTTSGSEPYTSIYLSAEPTQKEKERGAEESGWSGGKDGGVSGGKDAKRPWKREGKFKFTFEARSLDKRMTYKQMEANDHSFSDTARNWGYANFYKRSDLYFNNSSVRIADGIMITCTIVYPPSPPSPPPLPKLLIPKNLVQSYASLFDDPDYSDVCFRIRPSGDHTGKERCLYAAKKILAGRCEYFESMFSSGFVESTTIALPSSPPSNSRRPNITSPSNRFVDIPDETRSSYEDSEEEGEDEDADGWNSDSDCESESGAGESDEEDPGEEEAGESEVRESGARMEDESGGKEAPSSAAVSDDEEVGEAGVERDTTPAPSKRISRKRLSKGKGEKRKSVGARAMDGRARFEVVVTDSGYSAFRSLLYYLYTDSISFAPLSSSYHAAREAGEQSTSGFPFANRKEYLAGIPGGVPIGVGPGTCSAKAIYRLADKIGLPELKDRAFEHIIKSLTIQNIPYEVFGSFSLHFEEIKRVEIAFLLEKWNEVRASPSMRRIFNHIRVGRFPGFEDVWVRILESLEVRVPAVGGGNGEEVPAWEKGITVL